MRRYHGQGRIRDSRRLANEFDLVVTTYSTLGTDFSKGNQTGSHPLGDVDWHRVVLDEAHSIKESKSVQAKACIRLCSNLRWCVTGEASPLGREECVDWAQGSSGDTAMKQLRIGRLGSIGVSTGSLKSNWGGSQARRSTTQRTTC